ncbi:MAG: hypothetical protein ABIM30_08865 [candidate division WOR-3 bacterium]
MRFLFILYFFYCSIICFSQSSNDFMLGAGLDLLKTDNSKLFSKAQIGFELNYFVVRKVSLSAGLEVWTEARESFAFGARYYFNDYILARARGLIGVNDFSLGLGGAIPLKKNVRIELLGDFFFEGEFALRGGVAYIIR